MQNWILAAAVAAHLNVTPDDLADTIEIMRLHDDRDLARCRHGLWYYSRRAVDLLRAELGCWGLIELDDDWLEAMFQEEPVECRWPEPTFDRAPTLH